MLYNQGGAHIRDETDAQTEGGGVSMAISMQLFFFFFLDATFKDSLKISPPFWHSNSQHPGERGSLFT